MVLGTVQHVSSMDKLVACATHPQLCFSVAQNDLPPAEEEEWTWLRGRNHQAQHELACSKHAASLSSATYLASHAKGVKSSLCFVLKIMFLVLISRMDGGCNGVEMAKRASSGGSADPSSDLLFCP